MGLTLFVRGAAVDESGEKPQPGVQEGEERSNQYTGTGVWAPDERIHGEKQGPTRIAPTDKAKNSNAENGRTGGHGRKTVRAAGHREACRAWTRQPRWPGA